MDSGYSEKLRGIMELIVKQEPKAKILNRAKQVKIELTQTFADVQQAVILLDSMVNRWAPDKGWPQGFWMPPQPVQAPQVVIQRGFPIAPAVKVPGSLVTRPERIVEVARGLVVDGVVVTKAVVDRLRAEGDQRPEKSLAIGVGNVLIRRGWKKVGVGRYKMPEQSKEKETTKPML